MGEYLLGERTSAATASAANASVAPSTDIARDLLIASDGKILLTGRTDAGGTQDIAIVRLDANGWTETAAAELGPQESMWWWSATCAPQKLRAAAKPECAATERLLVRLADAKGHAAANTRITVSKFEPNES